MLLLANSPKRFGLELKLISKGALSQCIPSDYLQAFSETYYIAYNALTGCDTLSQLQGHGGGGGKHVKHSRTW